jgi:hypothetical protein
VPAAALLAIDREVLVTGALIGLIVAGLVVSWGAFILYRRERGGTNIAARNSEQR